MGRHDPTAPDQVYARVVTTEGARRPAGKSCTVDVDGPVHYVDYGGEGPPLLLIHGLGGSHLNWILVANRLAEGHRVVAVDLPGFGLSPPEGRSVHVADQAALLVHFIEQVFNSPAILVGNSMGGLVSLLTAAQTPRAVAAVVLINAALLPDRIQMPSADTVRFLAAPLLPGIGSRLVERFRNSRSVEDHVAATLDFVTANPARVPAEVSEAGYVMEAARREMPWSIAAFVDAQRSIASVLLRRREMSRTVHSIGAPVLIVHGDADEVVPIHASRWLAATRPDWPLAILPGVGHVPQFEAPDELLAVIQPWLAGVGAQPTV